MTNGNKLLIQGVTGAAGEVGPPGAPGLCDFSYIIIKIELNI